MAPFKIRPITVEDLPDLFRHVHGPDLDTAEVTVDYAANLDGPWPRSREEFDVQMTRLMDQRAGVGGQALGQAQAPRAVYTEGVLAAATWTLALTAQTPVTFTPAVVDNANVGGQITIARDLLTDTEAPLRGAYLRGVLAWFAWLAGAEDTITYPR